MSVGSVEHSRALLECSTPTSAKYQSVIENMPELSPVSLKIFENMCKDMPDNWRFAGKMRKITSCPLLQQEFIELKNKLVDSETLPPNFQVNRYLTIAAIAVIVITATRAFFPIAPFVTSVIGGTGVYGALSLYEGSTPKKWVKNEVDNFTITARNTQDKVRKFEELFQDTQLVEMIETKLTKVISAAPKDSVQQRTHQAALAELKKCADFCTVFART